MAFPFKISVPVDHGYSASDLTSLQSVAPDFDVNLLAVVAVVASVGIVASAYYILAFAAAAAGTPVTNTAGTVPAVDNTGDTAVVFEIDVVVVGCTAASASIVADFGIDIAIFDYKLVGFESPQVVHYFSQDTESLVDHFGSPNVIGM